MAKQYGLTGHVANRTDGVMVNVCGDEPDIESFKSDLVSLAPPAAVIKNMSSDIIDDLKSFDFLILPSKTTDNLITEISPDIAVCKDCLEDMRSQKHRINYAFINCTNCGPRFSIINELPYDRINTTMREFQMCDDCTKEYHDINNRRFHAQPVACNNCGPEYTYNEDSNIEKITDKVSKKIDRGEVVAIKGLGGYNLICDATNNNAVLRLRAIKGRDKKPFAVMFKNIEATREYCFINDLEKEIIKSWRRPIVLLDQKKELAESINNGLNSIGAILPYLPFHYLLFEKLSVHAIVYTSANNSGEPILFDDKQAFKELHNQVDAFISHNRQIQNPVDDSVVKVVSGNNQMIRRARGFVPNPVQVLKNAEGIFAAGAELKNCFCIGKNNTGILSQYIGDIKNHATYQFYTNTTKQFFELFKFTPKIIACDLHPEYMSAKYAGELTQVGFNGNKLTLIKVQHHHAHIVSCMAEHQINGRVIGVSFDGTGFGTDGNIWGGEFLICDTKSFERYAHFDYVKMPGGDTAVKDPWRMTLSFLKHYSIDKIERLDFLKTIEKKELEIVNEMIDKDINAPLTSSAGRLFDAVAGLLLLCSKQSFDAEGPMRLESVLDKTETDYYSYHIENGIVKSGDIFNEMIVDIDRKSISKISAKFHNTLVCIIHDVVTQIKRDTGINKVILSGGVFQNRYLLEKTIYDLSDHKFEVCTNRLVPPNDGGIALGQLMVASNYL